MYGADSRDLAAAEKANFISEIVTIAYSYATSRCDVFQTQFPAQWSLEYA